MIGLKTNSTQQKSLKPNDNQKHTLTSSKLGEHTTHRISKGKNKRCGVCNIIIEGKSFTFENPKTIFIISNDLSYNLKNVVCIVKCTNCKEIYIGWESLYIKATLIYQKIEIFRYQNTFMNAVNESLKLCQYTDWWLLITSNERKKFIDRFKPTLNRA